MPRKSAQETVSKGDAPEFYKKPAKRKAQGKKRPEGRRLVIVEENAPTVKEEAALTILEPEKKYQESEKVLPKDVRQLSGSEIDELMEKLNEQLLEQDQEMVLRAIREVEQKNVADPGFEAKLDEAFGNMGERIGEAAEKLDPVLLENVVKETMVVFDDLDLLVEPFEESKKEIEKRGPKVSQEVERKVDQIPEELTPKDAWLVFQKDGKDKLKGILVNGPVAIDKQIVVEVGPIKSWSSSVKEIFQVGNIFKIKTENGSEYVFDASRSQEKPDWLKKDKEQSIKTKIWDVELGRQRVDSLKRVAKKGWKEATGLFKSMFSGKGERMSSVLSIAKNLGYGGIGAFERLPEALARGIHVGMTDGVEGAGKFMKKLALDFDQCTSEFGEEIDFWIVLKSKERTEKVDLKKKERARKKEIVLEQKERREYEELKRQRVRFEELRLKLGE